MIEGNDPLPRVVPPWMEGLFRTPDSPNPTVVNNVETLANVPHILNGDRVVPIVRNGGIARDDGVHPDRRRPFAGRLRAADRTSLRELVDGVGGGAPEGRRLKAVFPGASNTIIAPEQFDTPLGFGPMGAVGTGLGSGGFVVYDDSACIVRATLAFSRFLSVESCGQCPACKHGTGAITELLERIDGARARKPTWRRSWHGRSPSPTPSDARCPRGRR